MDKRSARMYQDAITILIPTVPSLLSKSIDKELVFSATVNCISVNVVRFEESYNRIRKRSLS